jgi:circadian clock protein KaiC
MSKSSKLPIQATGVHGLDSVLCGGLPASRLYLVDGDPGAGKTTLGLQFLMEGARNKERVLYVSLSETKQEIDAVAASHEWDLSGIEIYELRTEDQLTADDQSTFFHPSEIELGETTKAILQQVERVNPTRVVFDSLSELRLLARESLRYRRQIMALKQFFIGRESTVLLLDDRTSATGDLELQSLVHGVIRLEQLAPEYGAERRRLRVLKLRGVGFRGGFHDFALRTGGMFVYPRLTAANYKTIAEMPQLTSGVEGLDKLLGGGADRGSSTLIMGPAGCGKSTTAMQYAISAAENGEKVAVFAFDEGKRSIFKRARSIGLNLDKLVENGRIKITQIDPAELSPGEFVGKVQEAVEKDNATVVLIDSLNGYLNAMPEERFLVIQMHEMLSYLNQKGVATFMVVAQHGLLGSNMNAPVDVSYLADTVLLMRYFEIQGEVRKAISVVKRRNGEHERTIREFQVSSKGISLSAPLKQFEGVMSGLPRILEIQESHA